MPATTPPPTTPEELFAGHPDALAVHVALLAALEELGEIDVRTSRSQVAYRRGHPVAYLWRPAQYLHGHPAAAVLSIPLRRHLPSDRWKEVVQPAPGRWVHHLEVQGPGDLDEEVRGWLAAAAAGA